MMGPCRDPAAPGGHRSGGRRPGPRGAARSTDCGRAAPCHREANPRRTAPLRRAAGASFPERCVVAGPFGVASGSRRLSPRTRTLVQASMAMPQNGHGPAPRA